MSHSERTTAIHEAGHAVAAYRVSADYLDDYEVSIIPDHDAGSAGHHASEPLSGRFMPGQITDDEFDNLERRSLTHLYAGYCAVIHAGQDEATARAGARSDFEEAAEIVEAHKLDEAACVAEAFAFVRDPKNWRAIQAVAAELLQHKRLDAELFSLIVDCADGKITAADLERYRARQSGSSP